MSSSRLHVMHGHRAHHHTGRRSLQHRKYTPSPAQGITAGCPNQTPNRQSKQHQDGGWAYTWVSRRRSASSGRRGISPSSPLDSAGDLGVDERSLVFNLTLPFDPTANYALPQRPRVDEQSGRRRSGRLCRSSRRLNGVAWLEGGDSRERGLGSMCIQCHVVKAIHLGTIFRPVKVRM